MLSPFLLHYSLDCSALVADGLRSCARRACLVMEGHMRNRRLALAGALAIVWLAPIFLRGQTPSTKAAAPVKTSWKVPRTPWGDPDLQGIWNNSTTTPLERPASAKGKEFLTARETAERDERAERTADEAPAAGDPGTY